MNVLSVIMNIVRNKRHKREGKAPLKIKSKISLTTIDKNNYKSSFLNLQKNNYQQKILEKTIKIEES